MISKTFLTAGRAVFTLEVPANFADAHGTAAHYTFKVKFKKGTNGYRDTFFVSLLTGPNNTEDFTYIGILTESGDFRTTAKSAVKADSMVAQLFGRVARRVFDGTAEVIEAAGFKLHHEGSCGRCGRVLTVPGSVESGLGPECVKKMFGCAAVA